MNFNDLNERIPHVLGKHHHVVEMRPYENITLAMPGRHQQDTATPGGDFVVMVDEPTKRWKKHQFTHVDIFNDVEQKVKFDQNSADVFFAAYAAVVLGADPNDYKDSIFGLALMGVGIEALNFLHAGQCLAIAEHRRYARFEKKGGGRFLPLRFAQGIVEGKWTAADCKEWQRKGRPGLEALIRMNGDLSPLTGTGNPW